MCVFEIAIRGIFFGKPYETHKLGTQEIQNIKIILPNNSNDVKDCQSSLNWCLDTACHTVKSCGLKKSRMQISFSKEHLHTDDCHLPHMQ